MINNIGICMRTYLSKSIAIGLILFFQILTYPLFAQVNIPTVTPIKPPEASAIDRVLEMPVSHYTGIPNISIPLYEITMKGITVPVTLNYHAGGIRVDQEATTVGLGWSLDYGGSVTRAVKGKPDDHSFLKAAVGGGYEQYGIAGFLSLPDHVQDKTVILRNNHAHHSKNYYRVHDLRPDEFYYSVQGYSGRFMLNQRENKFVFFPKEDIKVGYSFLGQWLTVGSENFQPIKSWTLALPNGITAKFGDDGRAASGNSEKAKTINAWLIKSLTNTVNETMVYNYDSIAYDLNAIGSDYYSTKERNIVNGSWVRNNYIEKLIKTISFPNGTVNFIYGDRSDLPTKKLTEIQIINAQGDIIRTIKFFYSYFEGEYGSIAHGDYSQTGLATGNPIDYDNKRLKLDYITVGGNTGEVSKYSFEYYLVHKIPSKRSYAQDYWGYFNGKANNCYAPQLLSDQLKGANKFVSNEDNKVFSLKSITYPTGGKTEFIYEGNTAKSDGPVSVLLTLNSPAVHRATASISMYGSHRLEYGGLVPTETGTNVKYFRKTFTIPANGGSIASNGWYCQSNYFRDTPDDNSQDCYNNNVQFRLEKANSNGTFSQIKIFRIRDCSFNNEYHETNLDDLPYLSPGDYRMTVEVWFNSPFTTPGYSTQFSVSWLEEEAQPQQYEVAVGGLRINTIKYFNDDGTLTKEKKYTYTDNTGVTSGQLISFPMYIRGYLNNSFSPGVQCTQPPGFSTGGGSVQCPAKNYCPEVRILGDPVYPLETTSGTYMGYQNVQEETVSSNPAENLITRYTYSFKPPIRDIYYQTISTGVLEALEWERGKLLKVEQVKNGIVILKEEHEYYAYSPGKTMQSEEDFVEEINTDLISQNSLYGYDQPDFFDPPIVSFTAANPSYAIFDYGVDDRNILNDLPGSFNCYTYDPFRPYFREGMPYLASYDQKLPFFKRYTGFDKPKKKTTTTTDDNGNTLVTIENYFYDKTPNNYQLTRTEVTNSNGLVLKSESDYATEFSPTVPYNIMVQRNMIGIPIRQKQSKNGTVVSTIRTNYQDWGGNRIAPASVETQIKPSLVAETRFEYNSYDQNGNALIIGKSNDITTTYIYGFDYQYVMAQAEGTLISDIAYTSFDDRYSYLNSGNWSISGTAQSNGTGTPFGKYSWYIAGSTFLSKSGLNSSKSYKVSYWSKNGSYTVSGSSQLFTGKILNGWTYYEHTVTGVSTVYINGTGYIDEVKLYPTTTKMTTYNYKPLVGILSVTDPNNSTTFYEYDAQNKLKNIKDEAGNILKNYQYHYQN